MIDSPLLCSFKPNNPVSKLQMRNFVYLNKSNISKYSNNSTYILTSYVHSNLLISTSFQFASLRYSIFPKFSKVDFHYTDLSLFHQIWRKNHLYDFKPWLNISFFLTYWFFGSGFLPTPTLPSLPNSIFLIGRVGVGKKPSGFLPTPTLPNSLFSISYLG